MNTPNTTDFKRQPAGAPDSAGGQFAGSTHLEDTGVKLSSPSGPDLAGLCEPLEEDWAQAREEERWEVLLHGPAKTFDRAMPGKHRTAKNVEEWHRYLDTFINEERLEKRARFHAEMYRYGRAFKQEIPIPVEIEEEFEKMWKGDEVGFSEEKCRGELAISRQLKADLAAGRITPRVVGGRGATRRSAGEWIDQSIAGWEEAIRTRGRSNSVNVSNAEYRARQRDRARPQGRA